LAQLFFYDGYMAGLFRSAFFQRERNSPQWTHSQSHQSGQAGLIVVLLAVVVLTIGLSLFVRTSRQGDITAQQEESARIFNAAETGIEQALAGVLAAEQGNGNFGSLANQTITLDNANAKVNLSVIPDNTLETYLDQGSSAELSLTSTSPILINWSKVGCSQTPAALIITIHNLDVSTGAQTTRYEAVKGQGCGNGNYFAESSVGTAPYQFAYTLNLQTGDYFARIEPVFAGTDILATGPSIDKAQFLITSKAQDNSGSTQQAKAIEVKRTLSTPPSFMDYSVYSGSSIIK
jgi:Tfp pilus assembly protein PilX